MNSFIEIVKKAFEMSSRPFPWRKAFAAALCAAAPVIAGMLAGQMSLGLLGGMGSFAYLYVFNEPYAQRAKKIFLAAAGLSLCVAVGTLAAPHPALVVAAVGLIGAACTFIFGVFGIPGPAAIFFVLSFIMTTSMPIDPTQAPLRGAVVFACGCFSWLVSMSGWIFNPYGREISEVKAVYSSLAEFGGAVGSADISIPRHRMVTALRESKETLATGYTPWKDSAIFNRLYQLNEQANRLFLQMLDIHFNKKGRLPEEFELEVREMEMKVRSGELIKGDSSTVEPPADVERPSFKSSLVRAADKDSIVFLNSVRYGAILSAATAVAFSFGFTRPYWITLSCASVMLGATIMSTFHRALQRSTGTLAGLIIANLILTLQPKGFLIVALNMALTMLTELFIVKNYAVATMFITPNALLIAENATKIHDISYFASARITDILVGSAIGLIGTYLIGRKSASSRLPGLAGKLIRSQSRVLVRLAANKGMGSPGSAIWMKEKMNVNLSNFRMAYNTALGEVPNDEELLEIMWPAYISLEHISYILERVCTDRGYIDIADDDLAQLLLALETMAASVEQSLPVQPKRVRIIEGLHKLCEEINTLGEALSIEKDN